MRDKHPRHKKERARERRAPLVLVNISDGKIHVFSSDPDGVEVRIVRYSFDEEDGLGEKHQDCNGSPCKVIWPDVYKLAKKYWFE